LTDEVSQLGQNPTAIAELLRQRIFQKLQNLLWRQSINELQNTSTWNNRNWRFRKILLVDELVRRFLVDFPEKHWLSL
jgi:hypothetical protein